MKFEMDLEKRMSSVRATIAVAAVIAAAAGGLLLGGGWRDGTGQATAAEQRTPAEGSPKQLWTCGMHPQVIQDKPGNCPICGMQLTPVKNANGNDASGGKREVRFWWDPMMSPPYISDKPGKSPMGMDLVPVYADEVSGGATVVIDPVVVQNMGVRVATVDRGPLYGTVRAVAYLTEAESHQHDINLRVSGWIEHLYADVQGAHIHEGDPMFDLYSPELRVAIEELIAARKAKLQGRRGGAEAARPVDDLYVAAERKLRLLGLSEKQTEQLAQRDHAPETVTFASPISGHVMEKEVVSGAAVKAGDRVLRIVDHSLLWLDVQVFEQQLPFIHLGQEVTASVDARPGESFSGKVSFIHPHIEPETRTGMVRVELPNPALELRPGMFATVQISSLLAQDALRIPRAAVIDSGVRQIVFVAREGGHFEPRRVTMGPIGDDDLVQIVSGLAPGEVVVTSGQFLLDAESRLQEAIQKHLRERLLAENTDSPKPAGTGAGAEDHSSHDQPNH